MKWIDTAEDTLAASRAQGATPVRLYDRKAWASMTHAQRQAAHSDGLQSCIKGVRYRLDGCPWLIVGRKSLADEDESWTLWDMRTAPPSPLAVGIPTLDLAQKLGNVVVQSRVVRLVLGASMVGAATVAALASLWRRERPAGR